MREVGPQSNDGDDDDGDDDDDDGNGWHHPASTQGHVAAAEAHLSDNAMVMMVDPLSVHINITSVPPLRAALGGHLQEVE